MARRSAETPRLPSQGSGPGSIAVVRDALWLADIPGDQVGPCPVDGTGCHPPHSQFRACPRGSSGLCVRPLFIKSCHLLNVSHNPDWNTLSATFDVRQMSMDEGLFGLLAAAALILGRVGPRNPPAPGRAKPASFRPVVCVPGQCLQ